MRRLLLALVFCLVAPVLAAAPTPPPLLAVLEFDSPDKSASFDELQLLTDAFRAAVIDTVGSRYKVLTRETMAELVPPERMECFAGKCAAEIGRMLQAPYVMAGNVRRLDGTYILTMEAYESIGGQALGSRQLEGERIRPLLVAVRERSPELVRKWLRLVAAPVVTPDPGGQERAINGGNDFDMGAAEEVIAAFESEPPGAVVMVDGRMVCRSTPCTKSLSVGEHNVSMSLELYEDTARTVRLSKKDKRVSLTLPALFGTVEVDTVPAGLPVAVDGKVVGNAPQSLRLDPGQHAIVVKDRCWQETGEQLVVQRNARRSVRINAMARMGGLKLTAADEDGNDVEGSVEVDGRVVGETPLAVKLPVCSREVVVKAGARTWKQALSLREAQVSTVVAVLKKQASCPEGMVFIPGGTFDMGSNDGDSDEKPVHRVTISGFCLDRTEAAGSDGLPIVNVSWDEAKAACERRGARLPTEAEWEFAARGTAGRKYPWGNSDPTCDKANISGCGGSTKRVGSLPAGATPEGVLDLAGNVWEWVADYYNPYVSGSQADPVYASASQYRVVRGGSFCLNAAFARSANRYRDEPSWLLDYLGFRCARGADGP